MARELTEEEVRQEFLRHVRALIRYWHGDYDCTVRQKTCLEKLEGLAFSILVTLDGEDATLPPFIVAPTPHPDDKEYLKNLGDNWYPENHDSNVRCDIAGCLHEQLRGYEGRD